MFKDRLFQQLRLFKDRFVQELQQTVTAWFRREESYWPLQFFGCWLRWHLIVTQDATPPVISVEQGPYHPKLIGTMPNTHIYFLIRIPTPMACQKLGVPKGAGVRFIVTVGWSIYPQGFMGIVRDR